MLSLIEAALRQTSVDNEDSAAVKAEEWKSAGNEAYKKHELSSALSCYLQALEHTSSSSAPDYFITSQTLLILGNLSATCSEQDRHAETAGICNIILSAGDMTAIFGGIKGKVFQTKIQTRLEKVEKCKGKKKWMLVDLPGRGQGLIANVLLHPGDVLISEKPILVVRNFEGMNAAREVQQAFSQLSKADQAAALNLCNTKDIPDNAASEIFGIYKSNGCRLDSNYSGIFPTMSRINHSCLPNANFIWREDLGKQMVVVIRDILPGEEITESYLPDDALLNREERRGTLMESHGFLCNCSELCILEDESLNQVETLLFQLKKLRNQSNQIKVNKNNMNQSNQIYVTALLAIQDHIKSSPDMKFVHSNFNLLVEQQLCLAYILSGNNSEALNISKKIQETLKISSVETGKWKTVDKIVRSGNTKDILGLVKEWGTIL